MEPCAATPVRRPAELSSPTPSPLSLRQWRPAAQRNLRNQWSRLLAAKVRWLDAASAGRSHASALVNAHLSRSYMPGMDLGVLRDMPGIRDRASAKLAHKEVQCRKMLLSSYKEMVLAVSDLVKASRAMRCFSKASLGSPLVRFTDPQDDLKESGDGGGAPVFKLISISEFEDFAQELVEMFVSELQLKRLLVLELLSINIKEGADPSLEWSDELYDGALYEFRSTVRRSIDSCPLPENWRTDVLQARLPGCTPSHEVLQVYLTSWLANGNIKMSSDIQLAVQLDARKGTMDFAGDTQKNIASMGDPELTKVLVRLSEGNSCLIVVDDPKARGFNVAMFSCNEKSKLGRFDHPKARGYC